MIKKFLLAGSMASSCFAGFSTWSGNLPRPVLFVHGINSDYKTWGVTPAKNWSNFFCQGSGSCFYDNYEWQCLAYRHGTVSGYKPGSPPAELAAKYGITGAGLLPDAPRKVHGQNGEMVDIITNPKTQLNHNGIEFYNSINYRSTGATLCNIQEMPNDAVFPQTDPFATLVYTNGVNTDAHCGWTDNRRERIFQLGQTDQVYNKIAAVLDEYFTDWRTNGARTLDIVCHSQGCLATRNAIATYRSANPDNPVNHINSIVSVNSPAMGTAMATDYNGLHSVQRMRDIVIKKIYNGGGLNPVRIGLITVDPLGDIRKLLENFILRQVEVSYVNSFTKLDWEPQGSAIATTGVTSGSSFTSTLASGATGPVTRPSDASKIPLTALYGTVPGLAKKLLSFGVISGRNACNQGVINGNDLAAIAQGLGLTDKSCHGWINYIESELNPIFTEMDVQWTPYSDMIVDQASQQYGGKLNEMNHPFRSKQLQPYPGDLGVPHMSIGGVGAGGGELRGSTLHGKEIVDALANPPVQNPFVMPVVTVLMGG
jgi:hypothetical protein